MTDKMLSSDKKLSWELVAALAAAGLVKDAESGLAAEIVEKELNRSSFRDSPFPRWIRDTAIFASLFAVFQAVFLGVVGFALRLPFSGILLTWVLATCGGFAGYPIIYWARLPDRPAEARRRRYACAVTLLMDLLFGPYLIGAINTGLVTPTAALYEWLPIVLISSGAVAVSAFLLVPILERAGIYR